MPLSLDGTGSITGISTVSVSDDLSHVGDANTKISFPANDTISFETSGSEKIRIANDGNIGIGTISSNVSGLNADAKVVTLSGPKRGILELRGHIAAADTIGSIRFLSTNDTEAEIKSVTDSNGDNGDLRFETNGSERVRITSGGFLGIGAGANTNKPLHIYTGSSDSEIRLQTNSGTEQNSYITLRQSNGDLDFYTVQSGTSMKFHTVNTERFRIDSAGRFLKGLTGTGASRSSTSVRYPHFQLSSPWSSGLGSYKIECTDDYPIIFIDSNASYANGSGAGVITWSVKDGSGDYCNTASVRSLIDGTPSNDNAPGRLEFMTTTSGTSPTTKMTISSQGYVTKPNQPSFNVTLGGGQINSNVGTIVFTDTTTLANHNTGNHYNTSNGRFTAPVAGRYQINARMLTNSSTTSYTIYLLRVNANHVGYIGHNHSDYWLMESGSFVLNLQANDYVDCYLQQHSGHGGFNYASFSGFLIG